MSEPQVTNRALIEEPLTTQEAILTKGAAITQDFKPLKNVCAHLNAFHVYAGDPSRAVETNHYCSHLNNNVRQCLLYDSAEINARLIGIEYMISPELFETLPPAEKKLWHSHVYEVKSGMLIMPNSVVPEAVWARAEHQEMKSVVRLYGKVYHLWQTDAGHALPLGEPKLMTSFVADGQLDFSKVDERDERFGVSYEAKKAQRQDIPEPRVHPNVDIAWKG